MEVLLHFWKSARESESRHLNDGECESWEPDWAASVTSFKTSVQLMSNWTFVTLLLSDSPHRIFGSASKNSVFLCDGWRLTVSSNVSLGMSDVSCLTIGVISSCKECYCRTMLVHWGTQVAISAADQFSTRMSLATTHKSRRLYHWILIAGGVFQYAVLICNSQEIPQSLIRKLTQDVISCKMTSSCPVA